MICVPSVRTAGQRAAPRREFVLSAPIAGLALPPAAGMRSRFAPGLGLNRMVPSDPQAPPRASLASARLCTAPPLASMIFSLPWAKNPTLLLSGDQNGEFAPSVPAKGWAAVEPRGRTHNCAVNPLRVAAKATLLPSGATALLSGSNA